jgi:hypothetical protein
MLPQFGPLEGTTADEPAIAKRIFPSAGLQLSRGEMARKGSVSRLEHPREVLVKSLPGL